MRQTRLPSIVPPPAPANVYRPCGACAAEGARPGEWSLACAVCTRSHPPRTSAVDTLKQADRVVAALNALARTNTLDEHALQLAVAAAFLERGLEAEREVSLADELGRRVGRVDFMIAPGIALELKVDGRRAEVERQITGYARSPAVALVVLASARAMILSGWSETVVGKPLVLVHLRRFP